MSTLPELDITAFMPEIMHVIECLPETVKLLDSKVVRPTLTGRMFIKRVEVVCKDDRVLLWADTYDEIVAVLELIRPLLFPVVEQRPLRWWERVLVCLMIYRELANISAHSVHHSG